MTDRASPLRRRVNRRAFLRGAAGVSVALPFLESLPDRSAWAADEKPVFSLYICAVGGVMGPRFFPAARGPLTQQGLAATGHATAELARHADSLLFLSGINWPQASPGESHSQGLCMALTARPPQVGSDDSNSTCFEFPNPSTCTMATGPSADQVIASKLHPSQGPLVLSTAQANSFIGDRLSFTGPGRLAAATYNPYNLYQQLVGLAAPDGSMTPSSERTARLLLESRASVNDLVREDLSALLKQPRLSSADRQRLQLHFDSIRDAEISMGGMGNEAVERCSMQGLNVTQLEALKGLTYDSKRAEELGQLHLALVALAFACNYRRAASLQWGDAYDPTVYDVPSNERGWKFGHISHRAQSDSETGIDPLAEQAHAEIDAVRMRSLAAGLDHFQARGLRDQCFVLWTNNFADGPNHSFRNVPHIVWGNARGYLRQGEYVDAGGTTNNRLHNALITAAIRDTGEIMENFGDGTPGHLPAVFA